ncbi:ATP-binding cassette domain-containing protein [Microbacterium sp. STF-2]|uniref:ATP-binding cassette domain-containing protein n=1 Tax=Microbacterium sp. STF-2 TaxID=3031132 RepID=UPI002AFE4546|nr:ATP-binding cassette domain-containing protein [Microbacterium sp. STF-2]MEA1264211.1 ATP-binding cassette domain-containing protein [Microbacterium sp. STF-2]
MTKRFTVTDYKGVRQIDLSPTGRLVVIAGANGAGKSSFIDAITELFDPKGSKLTPKPIREGAEEARAEYVDEDLQLRIRRVWKQNGTAGTLSVEALDGAKYSRPSDVVASLLGGAIFDPVAFLNLDEKKQRDALLAKVELPFDLDTLSREKAGVEQRRLEAGREVKRLQGALASLPKPSADAPAEEVSSTDILAELDAARLAQRQSEEAHARYDSLATRYDELTRQIEELILQRERIGDEQEAARNQILALPDAVDIEPLQERLRNLDSINQAVRDRKAYERTAADLAAAQQLHDGAQAALDVIEQTKREGLAAAAFPVDGLSVDEDGVTFDGVPFGQVNSAMRRRVAFAIATAGDPKLKLVIVKDGDLLDADSLDAIREVADERGYTVLVERDRDESRQIGFTVRDGSLAPEAAA